MRKTIEVDNLPFVCIYCNHFIDADHMPVGEMTEHVFTCKKHPMRKIEEELAVLHKREIALEAYIIARRSEMEDGDTAAFADSVLSKLHKLKAGIKE